MMFKLQVIQVKHSGNGTGRKCITQAIFFNIYHNLLINIISQILWCSAISNDNVARFKN